MDILGKVVAILAEQCNKKIEDIKLETKLVEDLGVDDLDRVEITLALDDAFGLNLLDEEVEVLTDVMGVVNLVTNKLEKESGN
jgi:acyl carrier protein